MRTTLVIVMTLGMAAVAHGADPEAGKAAAGACAACHGANGVSNNPIWPNLAGQKDQYLIKQLKAFKSGERKDPLMGPMVAPLSDADIENLAAYYSSLPAGG